MEYFNLYCPSCGASIGLDEPRQALFCPYCGQKLTVDINERKVVLEHNVNINTNINRTTEKIIRDEAKIKKYEYKNERDKRANRELSKTELIAMIIMFPLTIACMYFVVKYLMPILLAYR